MGLDAIEIVMNIEDEFDLSIPDADADRLRTVGNVYEYLRARVDRRFAPKWPCPSRSTFLTLRDALAAELPAFEPRTFRPSASLAACVPSDATVDQLDAVSKRASLKLPHELPLGSMLIAAMVGVFGGCALSIPIALIVGWDAASAAFSAAALFALIAFVAVESRRPTVAPRRWETRSAGSVRDWIRAIHRANDLPWHLGWTDAAILRELQRMIGEWAGVAPETVTREKRLLHDFGS